MRQRLEQRAELINRIRAFMQARGILEVTTPCLIQWPVSDVYIDSLRLATSLPWYLRTSPESAHKHLLSHGLGDIYEMGPVFRGNESGRYHQPEFTLLEWYRLNFDWKKLALEVIDLIHALTVGIRPSWPVVFQHWNETTQKALGFDLQSATRETCEAALPAGIEAQHWSDETLKDYLYASVVQPSLDPDLITVVHDYPADQAALAQLSEDGQSAKRFEVFIGGVELANGYQELSDAQEQRERFERDAQLRALAGRGIEELDTQLLAALERGLPPCAGVALGVDRLMMVILGHDRIDDILCIAHNRPISTH